MAPVPDPTLVLLGSSRVMCEVRDELLDLAPLPWPVRLEGPSGVGKGVAARLMHDLSPRADRPFKRSSMTLFSSGLEMDQLVGHVRGAFTGACGHVAGVFEQAQGGTLFLDEIADASPAVQGALLQLTEDRAVVRLGEERARRLNVRLVFATNADLKARVAEGSFRGDLFHRLGALVVHLPPLCDHLEDIPEIVPHLMERIVAMAGEPKRPLTDGDLEVLLRYPWPGNVRELENVLISFTVRGWLPPYVLAGDPERSWRDRLDETLTRCGGNRSATARALGVSRKTIYQELSARREEDEALG